MAGLPNKKPPIGRLFVGRGLLRGRCGCFALSRALEAFRFHAGIEFVRGLGCRLGWRRILAALALLRRCRRQLAGAGSGALSPLLAQADKIRAKAAVANNFFMGETFLHWVEGFSDGLKSWLHFCRHGLIE
jgi:hypothetical protein